MRLLNKYTNSNYLKEEVELAVTREELLVLFTTIGGVSGHSCEELITDGIPFTYSVNFKASELSEIISDIWDDLKQIARSELSKIIVKEVDD